MWKPVLYCTDGSPRQHACITKAGCSTMTRKEHRYQMQSEHRRPQDVLGNLLAHTLCTRKLRNHARKGRSDRCYWAANLSRDTCILACISLESGLHGGPMSRNSCFEFGQIGHHAIKPRTTAVIYYPAHTSGTQESNSCSGNLCRHTGGTANFSSAAKPHCTAATIPPRHCSLPHRHHSLLRVVYY